jgi:poly(3-hydroxybutyrate) depolymerase
MAAAGLAIGVVQSGLPWWMRVGDRNHVYQSEAGSLRYQVHLPPQYDSSTRLPVVMAIHGCGMTGTRATRANSTAAPQIRHSSPASPGK